MRGPNVRSLRQPLFLLALMFAASASLAGGVYALQTPPGGGTSGDIIDCRDACRDSCSDYRTPWQSIKCFFAF